MFLGRGVFAKRNFEKGEYLIEYKGLLKEKVFDDDDDRFVFDFTFKGKAYR